jgi:hypothetical protein
LASSEQDGQCYIQTANLDGETDFKPRKALLPSTTLDDAFLNDTSTVHEKFGNLKGKPLEYPVFNNFILGHFVAPTPNSDLNDLNSTLVLLQGTPTPKPSRAHTLPTNNKTKNPTDY